MNNGRQRASDHAADERVDLNQETAKIAFAELQRFFAGGKVWHVHTSIDLIAVGDALARDDTAMVSEWRATNLLSPVSDDSARRWLEADAVVWALVVAPFVLVQELSGKE